ncbi:MAG: hypothetical protein U5L05_03840 [Rubrivivax sp.]|nr:hypothetical protein [Rubrivivax sp.]
MSEFLFDGVHIVSTLIVSIKSGMRFVFRENPEIALWLLWLLWLLLLLLLPLNVRAVACRQHTHHQHSDTIARAPPGRRPRQDEQAEPTRPRSARRP